MFPKSRVIHFVRATRNRLHDRQAKEALLERKIATSRSRQAADPSSPIRWYRRRHIHSDNRLPLRHRCHPPLGRETSERCAIRPIQRLSAGPRLEVLFRLPFLASALRFRSVDLNNASRYCFCARSAFSSSALSLSVNSSRFKYFNVSGSTSPPYRSVELVQSYAALLTRNVTHMKGIINLIVANG